MNWIKNSSITLALLAFASLSVPSLGVASSKADALSGATQQTSQKKDSKKDSKKSSKKNNNKNNQKVKHILGLVDGNSSMHTLVVIPFGPTSERLTFITNDRTDKKNCYGLIEGCIVDVTYTENASGNLTATSISSSRQYTDAIGRWIDKSNGMAMGIEIGVNGRAESINMSTLVFRSWEFAGEEGKLLIHGKSIGNRLTSEITEFATISKAKNGKLIMTLSNGIVYTKQ